jgi:hypothetical protein
MLINFCNPNQSLAAIQIDGSVMTFFFGQYTAFRDDAFNTYLKETFKIRNIPGQHMTEKSHNVLFHKESSHLPRLKHLHLNFEKTIDKQIVNQLIDAIKQYQGKSTASFLLRNSYEERQRKAIITWVDYFYKKVEYWKSTHIDLALPILSNKNLKRLKAQFDTMPAATISSSRQIINFLQSSTTHYNLELRSSQPLQEVLAANTCPQLNALVQGQNDAVDRMFTLWHMMNALVAGSVFYYIRNKCCKPQNNRERPALDQPPEPRLRPQ